MNKRAYGCTVVGQSGQGSVDVVFVHGIRGDPFKTWTARSGTDRQRSSRFNFLRSRKPSREQEINTPNNIDSTAPPVFWPRDLLLQQVSDIRIITFGYDAEVSTFLSRTSDRSIFSIAQDLVVRLEMLRESTKKAGPIIFVAHSLGGIIVKDALKFSQEQQGFQSHLHSIFASTYGVAFMGTPHRGSNFANMGRVAAKVAGLGLAETDQKLLTALELGSVELERIADSFSRMISKRGKGLEVYSFLEGLPLTGLAIAGKVVEPHSAILGDALEGKVELQKDHTNLGRFLSMDDPDFQLVCGVLRRWITLATQTTTSHDSMLGGTVGYDDQIEHPTNLPTRIHKGKEVVPPLALQTSKRLDLCIPDVPSRHFGGRQNELNQIAEAFDNERSQDRPQCIICLYGLGGVGKTQLALTYVRENLSRYDTVFWINSSSENQILDHFRRISQSLVDRTAQLCGEDVNFRRIALDLGLSQVVSPATGEINPKCDGKLLVQAVLNWLQREENRGWIIVFDNADDLEGVDFVSYFPQSSMGDILLTSRRSEASQLGVGIEVQCLQPDEARRAFMRYAQLSQDDATITEDCHRIAVMLGCLPLALAQAGSYAAMTKISTKDFITKYQLQRDQLLSHKPAKALWRYGETVFTTWEVSFEVIASNDPLAAKLLLISGYMDPDDVWLGIFQLGLDPIGRRSRVWQTFWPGSHVRGYRRKALSRVLKGKGKELETANSKFRDLPWLRQLGIAENLEKSIQILTNFSIVSVNPSGDGFLMHPLVREWCRLRVTSERQSLTADFITMMGRLYDNSFNRHAGIRWDMATRLTRHIPAIIHTINELDTTDQHSCLATIDICHALEAIASSASFSFVNFASREDILFVYQLLFKICTTALKPNNQMLLAVSGDVSLALERLGRYDEAIFQAEKRVAVCKATLGKRHPDTLSAMNDLGKCLVIQGKDPDKAEAILREVIQLPARLSQDSSSVASSMINLAMLFLDRSQVNRAKELLEDASACLDGSDNLVLRLECLGCLASCASESCDQKLALEYLNKAVGLAEREYGPDSSPALEWRGQRYYLIMAVTPLYSTMAVEEMEQEILSLLSSISTMRSRAVDRHKMMIELGQWYYHMGNTEKAINTLNHVLEETSGAEDTTSMGEIRSMILNLLGMIHWDSGKLTEAIGYYDQCIQTNVLKEKRGASLNRAIAWRDAGQLDLAENAFSSVAASVPHSSLDFQNLASIYARQGRTTESEQLYRRTLEAMQAKNMQRTHNYFLTLHNQAILFEQLGNLEAALSNLETAFEGKQAVLGMCNAATLKTAIALRRLLIETGRRERAKELEQQMSPFYSYA